MAPIQNQNHNKRRKLKASASIRENERFQLMLSLPKELLSKIILRVAKSSSKSLAFTKLSCKALQTAGEAQCIYQQANLKDFPVVPWIYEEEHALFLSKCLSFQNPEALYRQGVMDYFQHKNTESALQYLKEAADCGHEGASYMMAIVYLLFKGDNIQNQKGVTLMLDLKKKLSTSSKTKVAEYRGSLHHIMSNIPWTPSLKIDIPDQDQIIGNRICTCRGWKNMEESPNEISCEACQIDEELTFMFDLLRLINRLGRIRVLDEDLVIN